MRINTSRKICLVVVKVIKISELIQIQMTSQEKQDHNDQKLNEPETPSKYSSTSSQDHRVLEICQNIQREFDQLSPIQVRQRLSALIRAEQEACTRRENRFQEIVQIRIREEQLRFREQLDKLSITFDLDAIRFEKAIKEKAFDLVRGVKLKHFDLLIKLSQKIAELHELQLQSLEQNSQEGLLTVAEQLMQLQEYVDSAIKHDKQEELAKNQMQEFYESLHRTQFIPVIKDLMLKQQHLNQQSNSNIDGSYQGIVSGDCFQNITSGSIVLSPQTTSPNMLNGQRQGFSNISQRANHLSANQIQQIQQNRQKFIYDLPQEFPFHDIQIRKNFSGSDFTNSEQNTYGQDRSQNNDVDPQDVLRTFTNSVRSGGTLSQLQQSLTYYKEIVKSNEWSNMSPSNAYQNFMLRKSLVTEVQKLARELNRIPTEEAKMMAEFSQSHFSQEGGIQVSKSGNAPFGQPGETMVVDLSLASKISAQRIADEQASIRQQAKRIVDGSATRLEPVLKNFTDVPLDNIKQRSEKQEIAQNFMNNTMTRNQTNQLTFNQQDQEYPQTVQTEEKEAQEITKHRYPQQTSQESIKFTAKESNEGNQRNLKIKERMDRLHASRSQSVNHNGPNNLPAQMQPRTALQDDFFMRGEVMGGVQDSFIFDELSRTANYTGSRSALDHQLTSGMSLGQFRLNQTFDRSQLQQQMPPQIIQQQPAVNPKLKIKPNQIKIRIDKSAETKPVASRESRLKVKFNTVKGPEEGHTTPEPPQRSPKSIKVSAHSSKLQPHVLSSYDCRVTDIESRGNNQFFESSINKNNQSAHNASNKASQQIVKQALHDGFDEDFHQIAQNLKKSRQVQQNIARTQHSRSRTEKGNGVLGAELPQQAVSTERKNVNKSTMPSNRRNVTIDQIKFSSQPQTRMQSQPQSSTNQTASIQNMQQQQNLPEMLNQQLKRPVVKLGNINFQQVQKKPTVVALGTPTLNNPSQSVSAQESPYLIQQKVVPAGKRVVHLKRPSTIIQMQSPASMSNSNFSQRAISRVEQVQNQSDFIPIQFLNQNAPRQNQGFRVKKASQQNPVSSSFMQNSNYQIYSSQDRPSSGLNFQE